MQDNNRYMTVFDDKGQPKEMYILFTTDLEEYPGKQYIFFTDPQDEEKQVFVATIEEDGLKAVENEEEWTLLSDVFNDYMANQQETGCGGCGGCGGNCENDCDGNCDCGGNCEGGCGSCS